MCVGPSWADSIAIHFPFGETAVTAGSAGIVIDSGVDFPAEGSKRIIVELRLATSSNSTDAPSAASRG